MHTWHLALILFLLFYHWLEVLNILLSEKVCFVSRCLQHLTVYRYGVEQLASPRYQM